MRMSRVALGRSRVRKDWRDQLRVGDVIRSAAGTHRVVRSAKRDEFGLLVGIYLVIRACSWTRRAHTVLTRSDIRSRGFKPPIARVRLKSRLDRDIALDIKDFSRRKLTCCDVHGVA